MSVLRREISRELSYDSAASIKKKRDISCDSPNLRKKRSNESMKSEAYEAALDEAFADGPSTEQPIFLRTLFNYDPLRDSGIGPARALQFKYGDILSVVSSSDSHWWKARRVGENSDDRSSLGLIPRHHMALDNPDFGYQEVEEKALPYVRPIVILGPLRERMTECLFDEFPDQFASCVPHTTRPRREGEVNGFDYHFVQPSTMDTLYHYGVFIEMGEYNGNTYGTSEGSVREVAQRQRKHCVLDVSHSIPRLHGVGIYPIVIFIKPESISQIIGWDRSVGEEQAEQFFERAKISEQDFSHYFTAIVQGDRREEIYREIKNVVSRESGEVCWIPKKNSRHSTIGS